MNSDRVLPPNAQRRSVLLGAAALGITSLGGIRLSQADETPPASALTVLTTDFPQKGSLILHRTRPPLLETPFEVFDDGVFTPAERFYVRWHLANIPTTIDPATFRLTIRGHVNQPMRITLNELLSKFNRHEVVAVNQCVGNSRSHFDPRVTGAQWSNGAMGNARWTGVRLKDILERVGVRKGAQCVRFKGLDKGVIAQTPDFMKSLNIDHCLGGEVMVAYAMNGQALPLLNGYPLRLVVPGWYATYWMKMLADIEVLAGPDENFWTTRAYQIPDTPHASIRPGEHGFKVTPVSEMVPRSFITNIRDGAVFRVSQPVPVRGIAFGGAHALARVQISADQGQTWRPVELGADYGAFSFRRWETNLRFTQPGTQSLMVRATDATGQSQPAGANWNGSGFMRNVIEAVHVTVT
ncbi:sulfide dehydrogenase [Burkholderia sp. Nafp2/4-1b]|uniref:molybdopterin-dependent oxidoreductase n=1 Tax=Burkholderia sp. Nafp2/4-1b TaxID=2116686 RepID=UPI000EF94A99|nr:molybdopterin-dependent oxidoreductase [Burkholderia sp. Nafp2/4-1b]RKT98818.1 sulfide dehydrogenase [Burkholderia sp. Nafp2/4-1b]